MRGIHLNMLSPVRIHKEEDHQHSERIERLQRLSSVDQEDENNVDNQLEGVVIGIDESDRPHKNSKVKLWDVIFLSLSIVTHIADIGLDINLAVRYLLDNMTWYFGWTIAFIILPTFVNTFISFRMNDLDTQINSMQHNDRKDSNIRTATAMAATRKGLCVIVLLLQLAPVLRYWDSLRYALKARKCERVGDRTGQRRYYLKMLKEDQDVALLRVFECFLEAAPQQILQLTILLRGEDKTTLQLVHQIGSICSSLVSMGWSMASYHRTIRLAQKDKPNISVIGTILQFLWHFCITVSRILSISIVASKWPLYTGIGCFIHWTVMTTWLVKEPHGVTEFCRDGEHSAQAPLTLRERIRSILFAAVLGTVYIFTYLNPSEGSTFVRHLFYYVLCLIENGAVAALWATFLDQSVKTYWYYELLIVLCIVPFCIGISAMILYYMFFHPTTRRKNLPSNNVSVTS